MGGGKRRDIKSCFAISSKNIFLPCCNVQKMCPEVAFANWVYVRTSTDICFTENEGKRKVFFLQTIRLNLFLACLRFFRKTANQQQNWTELDTKRSAVAFLARFFSLFSCCLNKPSLRVVEATFFNFQLSSPFLRSCSIKRTKPPGGEKDFFRNAINSLDDSYHDEQSQLKSF